MKVVFKFVFDILTHSSFFKWPTLYLQTNQSLNSKMTDVLNFPYTRRHYYSTIVTNITCEGF